MEKLRVLCPSPLRAAPVLPRRQRGSARPKVRAVSIPWTIVPVCTADRFDGDGADKSASLDARHKSVRDEFLFDLTRKPSTPAQAATIPSARAEAAEHACLLEKSGRP